MDYVLNKPNENFQTVHQAAVRKAICHLLQGDRDHDQIPQGPPCHLEAPSEVEFYVRWLDPLTEGSKWNTKALEVVIDFVMKTYDSLFTAAERPLVYKMAKRYLRFIASGLNRYLSDEAKKEEMRRLRANARKRRVSKRKPPYTHFSPLTHQYLGILQRYGRRVDAILTFPKQLGHHLSLYRTLGAANMSSDEEDERLTQANRRKTFVVKRRPCFSDAVSLLNKKLDIIHERHIQPTYTRGAPPSRRVEGDAASTNTRIPVGLPRNCYTSQWWKTLTTEERQLVSVDPQPHDFGVPRELLQRPQ